MTDIPLADLHMHAETAARLDRLASQRDNVPARDWTTEVRWMAMIPPGIARLERLFAILSNSSDTHRLLSLDEDAVFVHWLTDALVDAAADGALLVEVRFGAKWGLRPGFMSLFREAEDRVRESYPGFYAEALVTGLWPGREGSTETFESSLQAADEGLAGIDFIPIPYDQEVDWSEAYAWALRASDAGLGITAHAGEFSTVNLEAALRLPGLQRIGHGVHAVASPRLVDRVLERGVTLECCLTSNLVLGAVPSLVEHPIIDLFDAAVPITLATDGPVRLCTSLSREYDLAGSLGFDSAALLEMTRQAVTASFTSHERRNELLDLVEGAIP